MTWMVVGLTAFFFLASLAQLIYLQRQIGRESPITLSVEALGAQPGASAPAAERLAVSPFRAAAEMEVQLVARRYRQATILLMARVWTSYLGFATGMILALVGAAFILGKLRDPVTELGLKASGTDWALKTASPGIVMAVLGTALMLATLITHHRIDVTDRAVYLIEPSSAVAGTSRQPVPSLSDPYDSQPRP